MVVGAQVLLCFQVTAWVHTCFSKLCHVESCFNAVLCMVFTRCLLSAHHGTISVMGACFLKGRSGFSGFGLRTIIKGLPLRIRGLQ